MDQNNKILPLVFGSLIIIVTIAICGVILSLGSTQVQDTSNTIVGQTAKPNTNTSSTVSTPISYTAPAANQTSSSETATPTSTLGYKDGTYSSSGKYYSPAGYETIQVQVALKAGIIETLNITADSSDYESLRYQQKFITGAKKLVVGKKITEAYLYGRVSGASLTPQGFNKALDSIVSQSKMS